MSRARSRLGRGGRLGGEEAIPTLELEAGQTLRHYRLVEKIGEGGMGEVWRAEDLDLERPVALKFLTASALERDEMRARFLREARTAAALNHPDICTIHEVGELEGLPFIAMELIEGRTLDEHLRDAGRLPLAEIVRIALPIAEGLAAAHGRGIVHRDLKPGNVMLTADGQVKILDFGLAKPEAVLAGDGAATRAETVDAKMTREGTILGTLPYMSPEQAAARAVDARSDVFSFGVLLYQMASGELPFDGDTPTSTLAKILESEPRPLSSLRQGLPPDLERIVRRCLQKRPEDRYNDTRDLVAALRDLRTTAEAEPAPAAAAANPPRRSLWPWLAAAAAAVLAVLLVLGPRTGGEPEPPPAAEAERPSVAVLPFHNLSADAENDYFSAGMTEEIISKLSRIDGLEVASRSSVAAYQERQLDARAIGAELGVRYLLDGSVRRAGSRVRISTQLVDSSSGRNLWSEEFEGTLDDVFAIQEETALEIARQLDLHLSPQEERAVQRRSTDNVLAYDTYLKAQALLLQGWGDYDKLMATRELYRQALELDPDYAPAMAGLASVEAQLYRNFDSSEEHIERAEELAARAAALEPGLVRAQVALGEIAAMRYDYHRAERLMREVVRLEPKEPLYWDYLSWILAYRTPPDPDGAIAAAEEALRLKPDFPGALYHLGRGLILQGRYEEARAAFERGLELNPDFTASHLGLAQYHLAVGEHDRALEWLRAMGEDSAVIYYWKAAIHADVGDSAAALAALGRALESGFRDFAGLDASPYFAALRGLPAYRELLRRYRD